MEVVHLQDGFSTSNFLKTERGDLNPSDCSLTRASVDLQNDMADAMSSHCDRSRIFYAAPFKLLSSSLITNRAFNFATGLANPALSTDFKTSLKSLYAAGASSKGY